MLKDCLLKIGKNIISQKDKDAILAESDALVAAGMDQKAAERQALSKAHEKAKAIFGNLIDKGKTDVRIPALHAASIFSDSIDDRLGKAQEALKNAEAGTEAKIEAKRNVRRLLYTQKALRENAFPLLSKFSGKEGGSAEGLLTALSGSDSAKIGVAAGSEQWGKAYRAQIQNRMFQRMEVAKVLGEFNAFFGHSREWDDNFANAIDWRDATPERQKTMKEPSASMKKIAEITKQAEDESIAIFNGHGGEIQTRKGYMHQAHDALKMKAAGVEKWAESISKVLDWTEIKARMFEKTGNPKFNERDYLTAVFNNITSPNNTGARGASSISSKLSASVELVFQPGKWAEYNASFGAGSIKENFMANLNRVADASGKIRMFGPDADQTVLRLIEELKDAHHKSGDTSGKEAFETNFFNNVLDNFTGEAHQAVNVTAARIGQGTRILKNITSLGFQVFSSFADTATFMNQLHYNGMGWLDIYGHTLKGLFNLATKSGETQTVGRMAGILSESLNGNMHMSLQDSLTTHDALGKWSRIHQKMSLQNYWTDNWRNSFAQVMANHLAHIPDNWTKLEPEMIRSLTRFGITEADWPTIKKNESVINGTRYLLPEGLESDLAGRLQLFYQEQSRVAVIDPGMRDQAIINQGLKPGTPAGEAIRCFMHLKSFSITMARRTLNQAKEGGGGGMPVVMLMLHTTAAGYLGLQASEFLKGKGFKKNDRETLTAAFLKGGGMGIYGDFLGTAALRKNSYGQDPLVALLGPEAGLISDGIKITNGVAQHLINGEESKLNGDLAKVFGTTVRNINPVNFWWSKAALDHALAYPQEALSPGFRKRMQKKADEEGRSAMWNWD